MDWPNTQQLAIIVRLCNEEQQCRRQCFAALVSEAVRASGASSLSASGQWLVADDLTMRKLSVAGWHTSMPPGRLRFGPLLITRGKLTASVTLTRWSEVHFAQLLSAAWEDDGPAEYLSVEAAVKERAVVVLTVTHDTEFMSVTEESADLRYVKALVETVSATESSCALEVTKRTEPQPPPSSARGWSVAIGQ